MNLKFLAATLLSSALLLGACTNDETNKCITAKNVGAYACFK